MAYQSPPKLRDVEMLRGYAALAVALYHFLQAYVPTTSAAPELRGWGLLVERPLLLAIVNGPFMVTLFFVLSSFVLTKGLVSENRRGRGIGAIVKRFPRLVPLVLIGSLLPAMLFALGLYPSEQVAQITGSAWLERSGGIKTGGNWSDPSMAGAVADGFRLFGAGISQYNSALWTMKYELFGSMLALLGATIIGSRYRPFTDALIIGVLAIAALKIHPLCSICLSTVHITKYLLIRPFTLPTWIAVGMILLGLALGSTFKPFPSSMLEDPWTRTQVLRMDWIIHGIGATAILIGVRSIAYFRDRDWWAARQLGRLSFAIYVLHIPITTAVTGGVILAMGYSVGTVLLGLVLSLGLLFLVAWPVARLDEQWVVAINRIAGGSQALLRNKEAARRNPAP